MPSLFNIYCLFSFFLSALRKFYRVLFGFPLNGIAYFENTFKYREVSNEL